jgi:hypothetical protein
MREITRSLATSDRRAAIPLALELGAIAKHLFHILTTPMTTDDLRAVLQVAKEKLKLQATQERLDEEVTEAHRLRIGAVKELERAREVDRQIANARIETLEKALASAHGATRSGPPEDPAVVGPAVPIPLFAEVIDDFLSRYPKGNKSEMFTKHQAALALHAPIGRTRGFQQLSPPRLSSSRGKTMRVKIGSARSSFRSSSSSSTKSYRSSRMIPSKVTAGGCRFSATTRVLESTSCVS